MFYSIYLAVLLGADHFPRLTEGFDAKPIDSKSFSSIATGRVL